MGFNVLFVNMELHCHSEMSTLKLPLSTLHCLTSKQRNDNARYRTNNNYINDTRAVYVMFIISSFFSMKLFQSAVHLKASLASIHKSAVLISSLELISISTVQFSNRQTNMSNNLNRQNRTYQCSQQIDDN